MSDSEGIVIGADEDARVKVLLEASEPCIHCAEDVEVCNCTGGSSRVIVKALNTAGASVGDLVALSHRPGALLKSIAIFLVIPALGLIAGLVVGVILNQGYLVDPKGIALIAAAGLLAGIMISMLIYRGLSPDIQPFVSRVIRTGLQVPSSLRVMDPVCRMAVDPAIAVGRMSYNGKTYYFCQNGCLETFMKDPAKYA